MNVTEPIIQAALLGTANREFVPGAFPESLQTLVDGIHGKAEDTESFLYMTAASAFAYRRAGWEPAGAEGIVPVKTAPEEELPYFDKDRSQLFSRLHGTRYMLAYAYRLAQGSGKIISPEYLQPLIRRAYDRNNPLRFEERRLLKNLVGNRGLWLIRQMGLVGEECGITDSWDTATHGERKEMLARFRQQDSAAALELLRKDWKSEPANQRNELLECLRINISKADELFIQEVLESDRSSIVKETARKLLCMIPDSAMVMRCCELLRGHIRHNMLTGWSYDEIGYTPEMKAMGLSEVSSNKKEGDSEFILRQLAERVPLSFWCEVYGCGKEEAARKFAKHPPFQEVPGAGGPDTQLLGRAVGFPHPEGRPFLSAQAGTRGDAHSLPAGGNQLAGNGPGFRIHTRLMVRQRLRGMGPEILFQRHVLDSEKGLPVLCRRHGGTACHAYPVTSKEPDQGQGRLFGGGFAVHERVLLEDAGIHGS